MYHALCNSHLRVHQMTPRQFFRAAHMWKWGRDIPDMSLCNDLKLFDEVGHVPKYVCDYLKHIVGTT